MEYYANQEWFYYMTMSQMHTKIEEISTKNLHCYCDDLEETKGYSEAIKLTHTAEVSTELTAKYGIISGYFCRDYLKYNAIIEGMDFAVPWIIFGLNSFL